MPVSGQSPPPAEHVATFELLRSGLVERALANAPITKSDTAQRSHVRQTERAAEYHRQVDKLDARTVSWREAEELRRPPDIKRIHKGSKYGLPPPHSRTEQQIEAYRARLNSARANASVDAGIRDALPPLTANCVLIADYLANLSLTQDNTLYSYDKLAEYLNMGRATLARSIAALQRHGLLIVHRRQKPIWNGFQRQRVQARNDYEIPITRNTPQAGGTLV